MSDPEAPRPLYLHDFEVTTTLRVQVVSHEADPRRCQPEAMLRAVERMQWWSTVDVQRHLDHEGVRCTMTTSGGQR